ncbi:purine nucleoside phosphorylase YfiH [Tatumella ptyseos]|uniref:purine nucleoside phosphorylase YfiH n=1 Tax=Tatumella ptyseos TaxID=82987 RepID=UPI0026ED35E8|nr:purine nucleoside phosphorylase YfiH [Tatumella ptyseos]WKX25837.1 purine nucleoside phosphorylase YfiH [Tatumella ptyseos]
MSKSLIVPNWSVPSTVRAVSTTRLGGVSGSPWQALNLGSHVGDELRAVTKNRELLTEIAQLPSEPFWLNQIHSQRVVEAAVASTEMIDADASFTRAAGKVCIVMTADCLPVLFTNRQGTQVAAAHAGWRGLCDGILENTVDTFDCSPEEIITWVGPAIGPDAFEVGAEVREAFIQTHHAAEQCFITHGNKYLANLPKLAELRLQHAGVNAIYHSHRCTFSEPEQFFSYRRDGQTGRMASLIWITE